MLRPMEITNKITAEGGKKLHGVMDTPLT